MIALRHLLYSAFILLACWSQDLRGQDSQPPPLPPGPLIQKHAANFAKWTDTLTYGKLEDAATPPPSLAPGDKPIPPVVKTITKTGQTLHVTMPQQGQTWNVWCVGTIKTMVAPDDKTCVRVLPSTRDYANPFDVDFSQSDFPGFEWISLENYIGTKTYLGKKCIHFKAKGSEAYVDFESRLPVALLTGDAVHVYQFLPPPTENQTLPEPVQRFLAQRKADAARLQRVSLPAY